MCEGGKGGRKRKNRPRTLLGTYIKGNMEKSQKMSILGDFHPDNLKRKKIDIAYIGGNFARNSKMLNLFRKKWILMSL